MLASARLKEELQMGLMSKFSGPPGGDLKDKDPASLVNSHLDPTHSQDFGSGRLAKPLIW